MLEERHFQGGEDLRFVCSWAGFTKVREFGEHRLRELPKQVIGAGQAIKKQQSPPELPQVFCENAGLNVLAST